MKSIDIVNTIALTFVAFLFITACFYFIQEQWFIGGVMFFAAIVMNLIAIMANQALEI